jgi:hypothetical protein
MSHRFLISIGTLAVVGAVVCGPAVAGKAPPRPSAKADGKTPRGDPDLQGVWNDATSTPLQRPGELAGKEVLADEEAVEFQDQTAKT